MKFDLESERESMPIGYALAAAPYAVVAPILLVVAGRYGKWQEILSALGYLAVPIVFWLDILSGGTMMNGDRASWILLVGLGLMTPAVLKWGARVARRNRRAPGGRVRDVSRDRKAS